MKRHGLGMAVGLFLLLGNLLGVSSANAAFKVGLVLDRGGRDDKSFNAAAYRGATEAQKKFGIQLKYVEAGDNNAFESLLRGMAQKDFDLVISVGFSQAEPLKKVATQFPNKKFAIVDAAVDAPNVRSLMFEEHQGSYLVGYLAALASKTGKVGFIGGMDIPLIRRFELGYLSGALKANPKIKYESNFVGVTLEAWANPAKGKELALAQYAGGSDVIFAAAGASNSGVFDAAEEKKLYAIGVDSNQNWVKPGRILTSMLKRVDVAVEATIKEAIESQNGGKKFETGLMRFGLQNGGVDYALDQYNEKLITPEMKKKVEEIKAQILSGKIKVPDYYLKPSK